MKLKFYWPAILAFCLQTIAAAQPAAEFGGWQQTAELAAPEAVQAAAVDERFVYAIASREVAKYDRTSGKRVAVSSCAVCWGRVMDAVT